MHQSQWNDQPRQVPAYPCHWRQQTSVRASRTCDRGCRKFLSKKLVHPVCRACRVYFERNRCTHVVRQRRMLSWVNAKFTYPGNFRSSCDAIYSSRLLYSCDEQIIIITHKRRNPPELGRQTCLFFFSALTNYLIDIWLIQIDIQRRLSNSQFAVFYFL